MKGKGGSNMGKVCMIPRIVKIAFSDEGQVKDSHSSYRDHDLR